MAPGRSAPMGGRFARWNGQERAPNREPSQGSTDEVRTSLSRVRTNTTNPTQLAGYAVALPDDHNAAADTIWYSGSTLAADLSLPQLRRRWRSP